MASQKAMANLLQAAVLQTGLSAAAPVEASAAEGLSAISDPFAVLDPQNWVNPDNMTWSDFVAPPGTNWSDPAVTGSERNFNIALVTVDYTDRPFVVTQATGSTIYGNPLASAPLLTRDEVPEYYRDLLNTPNDMNGGHTLHEYWMGDSHGRYGVDLTVFGAYEMPLLSYQYGISNDMNTGACPVAGACDLDIRGDALSAWRADVGNDTADSFELVFILSAGQDESSTWQEFGEMKFQTKEDVPDVFGPPDNPGNLTNYAKTRYVEWSSWAASSNIWPNAGDGSSTQAESSGHATYAHELSHLLSIGDNYNNPYGTPLRRAYAGPFSMMDRGSFNGPGGPHSRWQIPALQGGSMGSLHTVRDKAQLGLINSTSILHLSREALADSGLVVASVTARAVDPGADGLIGVRVNLDDGDLSAACDIETDVLCDGGDYNHYHIEVVDRMGADSFTPDSGVMLSKTKDEDDQPFVWVVDANPQDIELVDFYRPNGSAAMITMGDYRQLADALFHAGTRSGSEFEHVDDANRLHFYVVAAARSDAGVLSYTVGVRSLDSTAGGGPSTHGVALDAGTVAGDSSSSGLLCSFPLTNNGTYVASETGHPDDASPYLAADIYRLNATVDGAGWRAELPTALLAVEFGAAAEATVAVGAADGADEEAVVTLTVVSESDPDVVATAICQVQK